MRSFSPNNLSETSAAALRNKIRASICVCTRNRADLLGDTIASILECRTESLGAVELIVVDNGSTDATRDVVLGFREPPIPIVLLDEPQPGQSRARNRALHTSQADVVLFTDDDVLVPADWLETMCAPFADPAVHAVQGRILLHPDWRKPWMEPLHRVFLAEFDRADAISLTGANMAVRRSEMIGCGGFDVRFGPGTALGFGDDTLAGFRLAALYGNPVVADGEPVIHRPRLDRLTRRALMRRMEQQVETEIHLAHVLGLPLPRQAHRPVWFNQALLAAKITRDRFLRARSPATQDELGALRSVLLSQHVARSRSHQREMPNRESEVDRAPECI